MQLRVAAYQMPVSSDIPTNTARILEAIEWAASQQVEILLTPEGSLSGYTHLFDAAQAEQALADITSQTRRLHLGLALGTCFSARRCAAVMFVPTGCTPRNWTYPLTKFLSKAKSTTSP